MVLLRERLAAWSRQLFPLLWRLAILVLPWQTRLFHEAPLVAGYPWEQGRSSLYVSWILMMVTVVVALLLDEGVDFSKCEQRRRRRLNLNAGWLLLCVFTLLVTPVVRATLQWWMEALILYAFFRVLWERVAWRDALKWFILALVPHALLGVWQAWTQVVIGTKWLGMATQIPETPGVAVVETGGVRWLRAYGGFPHPNVFGGWLMAALLLIQLRLKDILLIKRGRIFYYSALVLCSVVLALTYSRSAWIGLVIGTLGLVVLPLQTSIPVAIRRRSWLAIGVIVVSMSLIFIWRSSLVTTRAKPTTRLEQQSVNERLAGFENIWRVVRVHPLAGAGLGGGAWTIAQLDQRHGRAATIPILPHAVPFLVLMEFGLIGTMLLVLTLWTTVVSLQRFWKRTTKAARWNMCVLACALLPPLLLDHYVWSYWSGRTLFAGVLFFAMCLQKDPERI